MNLKPFIPFFPRLLDKTNPIRNHSLKQISLARCIGLLLVKLPLMQLKLSALRHLQRQFNPIQIRTQNILLLSSHLS
jgi:hypothetical protein